ncbi:hypothetical protein MRX96_044571 [Rhipicephalus microplus]
MQAAGRALPKISFAGGEKNVSEANPGPASTCARALATSRRRPGDVNTVPHHRHLADATRQQFGRQSALRSEHGAPVSAIALDRR